MLGSNNDLKVSHRKQVNATSNTKLEISLIDFECQTCEIFEGLLYHQENRAIYPTIFAATVGLGERINKSSLSKFMGMASSVLVTFVPGATYSCYSKKGYFVKLEYKIIPRNLKDTAKGLGIFDFGLSNIMSGVKVDV